MFATEVQPERVAAILIEPVQGDGGFLPAPAPFLRALRDIARRHGIVLIVDEIQTGFGRTGTMFAFQQAGILPDVVTLAKSLAGGLPLSAVVGRSEIMDAPAPGGLGGTYGGNALSCAAALAVLDAFKHDGLLEAGRRLGATLRERWRSWTRAPPLQRVHGLLVIKCGVYRNVIRFLAPLVTSDAQLAEGLDMFAAALEGG
jgi:4-aminobutyrate aminotransferase / (S)-3-amino-2-methylpropionate transaminase / 5-aminovalerate transaminase